MATVLTTSAASFAAAPIGRPWEDPAVFWRQYGRRAFWLLLLLAAAMRVPFVWRPVDGTIYDGWREPDVAAIARSFYREGMSLFWPRIDWRGDGPGYVESELPLHAYLAAVLYRIVGPHEPLLRVISLLCALAAYAAFFGIARRWLPPLAAIGALLFMAMNPLAIRLATAIQPEPLMFAGYLVGIWAFACWLEMPRCWYYWLTMGATALAILAKLPAIHVGILMALLCVARWGRAGFVRWPVWGLAAGILTPSLLWYWHARNLWLAYGNSLGMSNEAYGRMESLGFLRYIHSTLPGLVSIELLFVWTIPAAAVILPGLGHALGHYREHRLLVCWAAALAVFYLATGRTTGETWAAHYHVVSVPVAAMAFGLGMQNLLEYSRRGGIPAAAAQRATAAGLGAAALLSAVVWWALPEAPRDEAVALVVRLALVAGTATLLIAAAVAIMTRPWRSCVPVLGLSLALAMLPANTYLVRWMLHRHKYAAHYQAAVAFRTVIPSGARIAASGPPRSDQYGVQRAINAPYMFYWTDTKGFTLSASDQSLSHVEELQRRGVRFIILEDEYLADQPDFLRQMCAHHFLRMKTPIAWLFELAPRRGSSP